MKSIICSIIIFICLSLSAQTNQFDFSKSKLIDVTAGAWDSDGSGLSHSQMFFFDDGTLLSINNGETTCGCWKFVNSTHTNIFFTYSKTNDYTHKYYADINGNMLRWYHFDYYTAFNRIQTGQTPPPPAYKYAYDIKDVKWKVSAIINTGNRDSYQKELEQKINKYNRLSSVLNKLIDNKTNDISTAETTKPLGSNSDRLEKMRLAIDAMFREQIAKERLAELNRMKNSNQSIEPIVTTPVD